MKYANLEWRDGQPYNPEFDDVYFSIDNGIEETEHVFIHHNQLQARFTENKKPSFVITETGFGSGLNFLITVKHWLELSEAQQTLTFYSVENSPFSLQDIIIAQESWPELSYIAEQLQQQYNVASHGFHLFDLFAGRVKLVLMIGDVQDMLPQMQVRVDAWFLDGFAPGCNPDMWSDSVFSHIKRLSQKDTTISTYTAAGFVKRALIAQGFDVKKVSGTGNKRHMLTARLNHEDALVQTVSQPWFEPLPHKITEKKVTIIGGGLAGICSAWALVKRGFQVEIIEKAAEYATKASGNPAGMLMPRLSLEDSADAEFSTSAYLYALRSLQIIDPEQKNWQQTGGMQLASSERIKKQITDYPEDVSLVKAMDAKEASELSGLLINKTVHYFPQAACVYPKKLLSYMINEMGEALSFTYNTHVDSIVYENQQWQLLGNDEIVHKTSCLILANAWNVKQFSQLKHLELRPARGQLSYYKANQQSIKLKVPLSFEAYLMPENNGLHVSGASFELNDETTQLRESEFQDNLQSIKHEFDDLFDKEDISGGRASVRAVTADRLPIVGHVIDFNKALNDYADLYKGKMPSSYPRAEMLPGLFVNTGYGARGFSSAFLCSELLATKICDEPLPVSSRVRYALDSSRFLIRSVRKKRTNI
ncbi:MAG: bifunctional tRNA (5-methylaminomethyl-2-thiouridine)(34)-methyltransferase MnmD/FAD-dependent 5-carboxymethylaminomethyl-2-thiouridine(34) oxidoreductase MnmC [Gammaproteobacteria bacterium]|nr:bifunctional tRNA (5-methylaminomethyl-2-thiouridine)(34)-methyltransferase MnmD/FAD-dependent 5-carboxymethylaminomethyl-2-thiouridine(34) oxidoreductase MnmC [Gammaproteobacteria bacterium]